MAKQSIPSMELERSMNLMCRVMTIEEVLRNSEVIDSLDDKRREEHDEVLENLFEIIFRHENELEKIIKPSIVDSQEVINLKNKINELQVKYIKLLNLYLKKSLSLRLKEKELEKIDDENRYYLIRYTKECREKLGNENSKIEAEIIARRIAK